MTDKQYWWHGLWYRIFQKALKMARVRRDAPKRDESKEVLWKLYEETDSIAYATLILSRLLLLRLPYFEEEIAKSEQYPHEVAWEDFGDEMFELLAMCSKQLSHIITQSEVMGEFLGSDHQKELRRLQAIKDEYYAKKKGEQ